MALHLYTSHWHHATTKYISYAATNTIFSRRCTYFSKSTWPRILTLTTHPQKTNDTIVVIVHGFCCMDASCSLWKNSRCTSLCWKSEIGRLPFLATFYPIWRVCWRIKRSVISPGVCAFWARFHISCCLHLFSWFFALAAVIDSGISSFLFWPHKRVSCCVPHQHSLICCRPDQIGVTWRIEFR